MSVDSVSVWDEEAALQSCWLDCEASPTSAYRYRHIYKDNGKQVQTYLQKQQQAGANIFTKTDANRCLRVQTQIQSHKRTAKGCIQMQVQRQKKKDN